MAEVQGVAYGRAATAALRDAIRAAQIDDPLAPVTVVVPSNQAGLSARRTLAEGGGIANVGFVTPFALAERLGRARAAAAGLTPITEPVLVAAIRVELGAAPGFFAPVAEHAATESALTRRYAELSRARPATLERIRHEGTRRAQALVELFDRVRLRLAGYVDEDALVEHALEAVGRGGPAVAQLGAVIVHLPQPVPPALHDLVGAVVAIRPTTWIVGLTGDAAADAPVVDACLRWGVAVGGDGVPVATGTEMIGASDVDDEIRAVTRRLLELARDGVRMDRTAILMPAVEPYARTVHAVLERAGLAHNGPPIRRLADSIAGRTLARLVGMVDSTFARDDVIAYLASAPIRREDGRPVPVDRWDLISRRAGVVRDDDWSVRLARYADDMAARDRRAAEDDAGAGERPAPVRSGSVAHSTHELAEYVAALRSRLARFAAAVGWRERAEQARDALGDALGGARAQHRWPEEEREALDAVLGALDRLAALEAVEDAPAPGAFLRAVDAELAASWGRVGRFGEGVLCAPIGAAIGLDLDAVVVVGLAEGLCPVPRREDALLADRDRQLAVDGELAVRQAALQDQRRGYLAALAAGAGHRILSAPRGDLRTGRERLPSRYLLETATALTGRRIFGSGFAALTEADGLDAVPSYASGIRRTDTAANVVEHDLGVLAAFVADGGDAAAHPLVERTPVATGLEAVHARASAALTRWDGNVAGVRDRVRSPATGDVVSPTRLQAWSECPFRYLLASVLDVKVEDSPERLLELSPLDRGTLVHEVLERFVREELDRPEGERAPPYAPWPPGSASRLAEIMGECAAEAEAQGLTGKATLWSLHREEIESDLVRFLVADDERRVTEGVVPEAVELPFGLDGADAVEVPVSGGRTVAFRGRADRVDVRPDGTRVVLDYKTGKASPAPADGEDPLQGGARLQLPVYAEAARCLLGATDVEAAYWYVSSKGEFKRNEFRLDVRTEVRFRDVVGHIVESIDEGWFPAVPGAPNTFFGSSDNCRFCPYDAVCPVDRNAEYDAKIDAPEFAAFHALVLDDEDAGMTAATLVDEAARRRITTDGLDELLFVEAGAGTGKTKQLVDRVVALVLDRAVPMREIAAITFTEAAASELRARIREAFERLVHDDATPEDRRVQAEAALVDLDGAAIGTVHSFAQRILAEHPVEGGLPPHVEVLDEVESLLAFGRRWEAHVDRMFSDVRLDEVIGMASRLGIRLDDRKFTSLRDLAVVFSDNWDRVETMAQAGLDLPAVDRRAAIAALAEFGPVVDRCRDIPEDGLAAHWLEKESLLRQLGDLLADAPDRRLLGALPVDFKLDHGNKGQAAAWGGKQGKVEVRELAQAVEAEIGEIRITFTDAVLRVLAGEVARFTLLAAAERRREGRLEFHDLLVLARALLRRSADARTALHERYSRLLIDEFQDTDPIQIELAMLIAASVGGGPVPDDWSDIAVDPERLFFVGDPKQSIYRFRRASISLFLDARDRFATEAVRLSTNFRTVPPLVAWVNEVFGGFMAEERPGQQPRYEPLAAHRTAHPAGHRVQLLGRPHTKDEGLRAGPLRELEAVTVADAVAGILAEPAAWPVEDADGWRPARPEDIAILLPTRTSLGFLMDALRARGVEFRAETGTLVYETQEIRDLIAILRSIAHGADAVALVAALRSPILGCGDDDLVTYATAGGRWDLGGVRPDLDPGHPVLAALEYLDDLRAARWWTGPSALIERIVEDRRVMTLAFAAPRARDVWRRIRFLVDQARLFEASQSTDLVEFVAWSDLQRSDMARVHEPLLPESDDHAVRIMTMHGAKGLEFPITVLSGLTTEIGRRRTGMQALWDGDDVHVSVRKKVASQGFDRRADLEDEMDGDEKLRLLYVACTRGRDHLLVAAHHNAETTRDTFARMLWNASAGVDPALWEQVEEPPDHSVPVALPTSAPETSAEAFAATRAAEAAWRSARAGVLAAAARVHTLSATAVKRAAASGAENDDADDGTGDRDEDRAEAPVTAAPTAASVPEWRRGKGATAFGKAVHKVLEDVDLATGADVDTLAQAAAAAEGMAAQAGEVADATRAVLATPIMRTAAAAAVFREMYVAAPIGDRVVEGYIDLLVRTPDGLVIVDYKTDRLPDAAAVRARAEGYRLQLAAYAAAIEAATGERVTHGVLVFVGALEPVEAVEWAFPRAELGVEDIPGILARVG